MTAPIYAVGDIHGYSDQFDRALALIEADGGGDAPVIFLGDFVDRGPDSRGVLQRLIDGKAAGRNWQGVLGNHDRMFLRFMREGQLHDDRIKSGKGWLAKRLGGAATLASYTDAAALWTPAGHGMAAVVEHGLDPVPADIAHEIRAIALDAVPEAHLAFLETLPLLIETEQHIFVHAGIRPGVKLKKQDPDDLVWIREPFLKHRKRFPKMVVHGHTVRDYPVHCGNRINLDGGAGYGRPLVPAVFDGTDWHLLTKKGRELLRPRK